MELLEVQKEADSAGRKAIIFGLGALFLAGVFGWMLARLGGGGPDVQTVVVAAEEVAPLTQLKAKHLRVVQWPITAIPIGTFMNPNEIIAAEPPLLTLRGLVSGEPVLKTRLSTPERGLGVAQLVDPSMRAYVVEVSETLAKAMIIHPHAFVDVVATMEDPRNHEIVSKVVLQNVQVLAVGDSVDVEARPVYNDEVARNEDRTATERHRVITLLVNLNDVEYLAFAASRGKIDLALRSDVDGEIVPTAGVTMDKVMGSRSQGGGADIKPPAPPPVTEPRAVPNVKNRSSGRSRSSGPAGPSIYKVPHR